MMRQAVAGVVLGVVMGLAGWSMVNAASPQGNPRSISQQEGQANSVHVQFDERMQHLLIVDSQRSWFGLYRLNSENGDVTLTLARDFRPDMELKQFGGVHKPEVRSVRGIPKGFDAANMLKGC